eukprot:scaffold152065_cov21-Tisochrysis_lutea.AAC.4
MKYANSQHRCLSSEHIQTVLWPEQRLLPPSWRNQVSQVHSPADAIVANDGELQLAPAEQLHLQVCKVAAAAAAAAATAMNAFLHTLVFAHMRCTMHIMKLSSPRPRARKQEASFLPFAGRLRLQPPAFAPLLECLAC